MPGMKRDLFPPRRALRSGSAPAAVLALATLFGASCGDKPSADGEAGAGGGEGAAPAGGSAALPSPEVAGAPPRWEATFRHIDLGAEVCIYRDLSEVAPAVASYFDNILALVPEGELPPQVADFDLAEVLADLGLDRVEALGVSSARKGERYLNKVYLHTPRGRGGLLRLLGREAGAFKTAALAPRGTDLLMEREVNLSELYRLGRDLAKHAGAEGERGFAEAMGQGVADFGVTVGDLFQKLDTRAIIIGRLAEDRLQLGAGAPEVPRPELYVSLEGLGWLFDRVVKQLPPEAADALTETEGGTVLALPPNPLGEPVLRRDEASGQVTFATSAGFLEECESGTGGLFADAAFKEATADLPTQGNGLVYLSPNFGKELRALYRQALSETGQAPEVVERGIDLVERMLPYLGSHYAQVQANAEDGVWLVSNSPASVKQAAALAPVLLAAPAFFVRKNVVADERAEIAAVRAVRADAEGARLQADLNTLKTSLTLFQIVAGRYPTTEEGLRALVEDPGDVEGWEPMIEEVFSDPWGQEYRYVFPGLRGDPGEPDVFSVGPDGVPGTGDDIYLD